MPNLKSATLYFWIIARGCWFLTHPHWLFQACQAEIRKPLVDLGVSEYSIISTIDSLVDTENEISSGQASGLPSPDLTLFKQIALDLRELVPLDGHSNQVYPSWLSLAYCVQCSFINLTENHMGALHYHSSPYILYLLLCFWLGLIFYPLNFINICLIY